MDNNKYWSNIESDKIMGGKGSVGAELLGKLPAGARILDLGCGNGHITKQLHDAGHVITGIDINSGAIADNQARYPETEFITGDITQALPFESEEFDAVVVSWVFVSFIDTAIQEAVASEIGRVLKPGGLLWLREGLTSPMYAERYEYMADNFGLERTFPILNTEVDLNTITTQASLSEAIARRDVQRVARHYTEQELDELFMSYEKLYSDLDISKSPNSGTEIRTLTAVYKRS